MAEPTFLGLPAELRMLIYKHHFNDVTIHIDPGQIKEKLNPGIYLRRGLAYIPSSAPALLYTSKQIHREALPHVHTHITYAYPTTLAYLDIHLTARPSGAAPATPRHMRITDRATTFNGLHSEAFEAETAFPSALAPPPALASLVVEHACGLNGLRQRCDERHASLRHFMRGRFFARGTWLSSVSGAHPTSGPDGLVALLQMAMRREAGVRVRVRLGEWPMRQVRADVERGRGDEEEVWVMAALMGNEVIHPAEWAEVGGCFEELGEAEADALMRVHGMARRPRVVVEVERAEEDVVVGAALEEEEEDELVPVRQKMRAYGWTGLRNQNVMEIYDGTEEMVGFGDPVVTEHSAT